MVEDGSAPLQPREKATLTLVDQNLEDRSGDMLLFLMGGVSGEGCTPLDAEAVCIFSTHD